MMNKSLLFVISVTALIIALNLSTTNAGYQQMTKIYQQWKVDYQIVYENDMHDQYRYRIFVKNWNKINKHNREGQSYQFGLNQFSSMTISQFKAAYLTDYAHHITNIDYQNKKFTKIGIDIDWVQKGAVLPVKNSGSMCAASYCTSSVAALESLRKISGGQLKKLSEQEILDCSGPYGNHGCNSGLPVNTYKYVVDHGISDDSQYPYTGVVTSCRTQHQTFKISSYTQVETCNDLQLVLQTQPVSVLVDASNWMFYRSGVFSLCDGKTLNLAVLLVGMTDSYWRVRNQWGTSWGEMGYIRLQMGNCCGICSMGSAPIK